jgi:ABC-type nitrate/sulfonate/bicarbonate transport system substrate-binding protein
MAKFEHSRMLMIMAAVALAIVMTSLAGAMLTRTDVDAVVSPAGHAQRASEKSSESLVRSLSHVAHPHSQHRGHQKDHRIDKPLADEANRDAHSAVVARWHRDNLRNVSGR